VSEPPPRVVEQADGDTAWVDARALVLFFATSPDPSGRVGFQVHVVGQALDGSGRRVLTPHNAMWAQVSPDGRRLASIAFPGTALIVTELADGSERVVVDDVMPRRAPTLDTDLPPILQWHPGGGAILVLSPEDDDDGDGALDRATVRVWDVAGGTLVRELHLPAMGPLLFTRGGDRIAVPSLEREGEVVTVDLETLAQTRLPLGPGGLAPDQLHVNQTPSLVIHDTAIAPDGALLTARGPTLVLSGRGPERVVVTGATAIHSPAWDGDGRHAVFETGGRIHVYDAGAHRLGVLGPGEPSPLVVQPGYRPPPRRIEPPRSPFDLAFRSY